MGESDPQADLLATGIDEDVSVQALHRVGERLEAACIARHHTAETTAEREHWQNEWREVHRRRRDVDPGDSEAVADLQQRWARRVRELHPNP